MAPEEQEQQAADSQEAVLYCAHCGTRNDADTYSCDRCGERIYLPDPRQPPPLGLAECPKCLTANETRATYCVKCGSPLANAARITVGSAQGRARPAPHTEPGGIRISRRPREEPQDVPRQTESQRHRSAAEERVGRERQERERRLREQREQEIAQARAREQDQERSRRRGADMQEPRADEVNDSGKRSARLPGSARGWNTAAFLIGPIWGPANGVWLGILGLLFLALPLSLGLRLALYLGYGAFLGLRGNELAWRSKRWTSIEHFKRVQQLWMLLSLVVNLIVLFIILPLMSGS